MNVFHVGVAVLIVVVLLALLALFVAAVVSILQSPELETGGKILWIVIVLVFQFFGPIAWFLFGRKLRPNA